MDGTSSILNIKIILSALIHAVGNLRSNEVLITMDYLLPFVPSIKHIRGRLEVMLDGGIIVHTEDDIVVCDSPSCIYNGEGELVGRYMVGHCMGAYTVRDLGFNRPEVLRKLNKVLEA